MKKDEDTKDMSLVDFIELVSGTPLPFYQGILVDQLESEIHVDNLDKK
ncbi:TPA: hypothetical protein ACVU5P_004183 [Vibrio parahaemolyticus]